MTVRRGRDRDAWAARSQTAEIVALASNDESGPRRAVIAVSV